MWLCLCASKEKEDEERKVTEFVVHGEVREKNVRMEINKIINTHATLIVHICTVTVVIVYLYTSLHPLMWMIFCSNCVKVVTFSILHIYAQADVIALIPIKSTTFKK